MFANDLQARPDGAIAQALRKLAVPRDGLLLVHSAFRALGRHGHDAAAAVDAIAEHMAPGTLLMPTMSWRSVTKASPRFDELATPSITGVLTEIFRTRFATARSLHPTHSVAGLGRHAAAALATHHLDETPCSARSPYGPLVAHDGWIVLLGIGMECCTLIHHVEELIAPEIYLRPEVERYTCVDRHGRETQVKTRRHVSVPRDFWQFQDQLAAGNLLRICTLDGVVCRAFRARDLVALVTTALRAQPDATFAPVARRKRPT